MIDETLRKLQARIDAADGTSETSRRELLAIVEQLRSELDSIAGTDHEAAAKLARATRDAAGDAGGVEDAVMEFETAHPTIVGLVRSFLQTLAEAGI